MEYIDFPIEEQASLKERLDNNKVIYTTRVSIEVGKYNINNIYNSPLGKLIVISLNHYDALKEHPFIKELNDDQIIEINKYIKEYGFDLIGLKKYEEK